MNGNTIGILIIGSILAFVIGRAVLHTLFGVPDDQSVQEQPQVSPARPQGQQKAVATTMQHVSLAHPATVQSRPVTLDEQYRRQHGLFVALLWKYVLKQKRTVLLPRSQRWQAPAPVVGEVSVVEADTSSTPLEYEVEIEEEEVDDEQELKRDEYEDEEDDAVPVRRAAIPPVPVQHQPHAQYIPTKDLYAGTSFNLNKLMTSDPMAYLRIVRGLIIDLYEYYQATKKITRDGMVPSVYSQVHWNHLIGGIATEKQGVLRKAGIIVEKDKVTSLGYPGLEMACARFRQWHIDEEQGTKVVSLPDTDDEEEIEEEEREEDLS